jgi:hypothetical protein
MMMNDTRDHINANKSKRKRERQKEKNDGIEI